MTKHQAIRLSDAAALLPAAAQKIWQSTMQAVFDADPKAIGDTAERVAMSAVKQRFVQNEDGTWKALPKAEHMADRFDFSERLVLDADAGARISSGGYLAATPRVARTGIQLYRGYEVGKYDMDTVRVYRSPEEVFSKDSMASFAHKPVTNDHPPVPVTAENWKDYAVGQTGDEVARDGEFIRVPMSLMDAKVIADVKSGKKELSEGYSSVLVWGAGTSPQGEAYDAMQTHIRANHTAVVKAARGGAKLAIGDQEPDEEEEDSPPAKKRSKTAAKDSQQQGAKKMSDVTQTIMVDGLPVEVTAKDAAIINRCIANLDALFKKATAEKEEEEEKGKKFKKDFDALTASSQADAATKDAKIVVLEKQVADAAMTPAKLDALVKDRAEMIGKAKAILGDKLVVDGKSDAEIRQQVVAAQMGDKAAKYTADQMVVAFDTLTAGVDASKAPSAVNDAAYAFSRPNGGSNGNPQAVKDNAQKGYQDRLQNAWKGEQPKTN